MKQTVFRNPIASAVATFLATSSAPVGSLYGQNTPIVFVHGLGASGSWFDPLASHLAARYQIARLQVPQLGSGSLYERQAAVLRSYLQQYAPGRYDVAAISHSNGGVVTREYVRQTAGAQVDRHLSIGTPHRGARLAYSLESGELSSWAVWLAFRIWQPVVWYGTHDDDWPWIWFSGGSSLYLEWNAYALAQMLEAGVLAGVAAVMAAIYEYPPVISQMWPGSPFFERLNAPETLMQEAQRMLVARVGLSTQYPPQLMPWRIVVCGAYPASNPSICDWDAMQWEWARQDAMWLAWQAYWYYSGHWDWELRANAWMWEDMFYALMTIPGDWEYIIGSSWGENDGIVPWSSSDYPGGTRNVRVTLQEKWVYHVDQLSPVPSPDNDKYWWNIRDVVSADFGIPSIPPPPPQLMVSISGPTTGSAYEWVTMTATVSNYLAPVTYSWEVNGYAACGNQSTCSTALGPEGSYTTFSVTVTDAQPATASAFQAVFAQHSACPQCGKLRVPGAVTVRADKGKASGSRSRTVVRQPTVQRSPRR